jgi:hypothetical protein
MAMATPGANNNMYRVGDYVYFETSAAGPYAIRRIEELNKTLNGKNKMCTIFLMKPLYCCLMCWVHSRQLVEGPMFPTFLAFD